MPKLVEVDEGLFVADYLAGETMVPLARRYGISTPRASKILKAAGIEPRFYGNQRRADRDRGKVMRSAWKPSRWLDPDPITVAYIAGIIDGEGSIGTMAGDRHNNQMRLSVGQLTETGLCDWLQEVTGVGRVQNENKPNRRPMSSWQVLRQAEILDLVLAVRPLLRVKAAAADAALVRLSPYTTDPTTSMDSRNLAM